MKKFIVLTVLKTVTTTLDAEIFKMRAITITRRSLLVATLVAAQPHTARLKCESLAQKYLPPTPQANTPRRKCYVTVLTNLQQKGKKKLKLQFEMKRSFSHYYIKKISYTSRNVHAHSSAYVSNLTGKSRDFFFFLFFKKIHRQVAEDEIACFAEKKNLFTKCKQIIQ